MKTKIQIKSIIKKYRNNREKPPQNLGRYYAPMCADLDRTQMINTRRSKLQFSSLILCISTTYFGQDSFALSLQDVHATFTSQEKVEPKQDIPQKVVIDGNAKSYDPQRNDVAGKRVVKQEELTRFGDANILDALQKIQGVQVRNNAIYLVGMLGSAQLLIDGQIAPRGFLIENLSPSAVEKVEIIRTGTADMSAQASSGSINFILKKIAKPGENRVNVTLEKKYKTTEKLDWQYQKKSGQLSFNSTLTAKIENNTFSPHNESSLVTRNANNSTVSDENSVDDKQSRGQVLNFIPRLLWQLDKTRELNFNSMFSDEKRQYNSRSSYFVNAGPSVMFPTFTKAGDSHRTNANSTLIFKDKTFAEGNFEGRFYVGATRTTQNGTILGFSNQDQPISDTRSQLTTSISDFGLTGKYGRPITESHDFEAGYDLGQSQYDFRGSRKENNLRMDKLQTVIENNYSKFKTAAFFAQDVWEVNKALSIYLGYRWEGIETETTQNDTNKSKFKVTTPSPIIQTLWKLPSENSDQIRLAVARTYKAPDTIALLSPKENNPNNSIKNPNFQGNIGLKPEHSLGLEGSFEHHNESDQTNLVLRTYFRKISDLQRPITSQSFDGTWILQFINQGNAYSKGFGMDLDIQASTVFSTEIDATIRMGIDKNWTSIEAIPGPRNQFEPSSLSFNLGADYSSKDYPLTTGFTIMFSDGGWVSRSMREKYFEPVSRIASVYINWKFNKKTKLNAAITGPVRSPQLSIREYDDTNIQLTTKNIRQTAIKATVSLTHQF